jgi:hypothetical protein
MEIVGWLINSDLLLSFPNTHLNDPPVSVV